MMGLGKPKLCFSWWAFVFVFLLPHCEDRMILPSFVWIRYQRVTDGQMDGIAVGITSLCIASNAAVL